MMIPAEIVDRIRDAANGNMVSVISDYTSLTPKRGVYSGICPFCKDSKKFNYNEPKHLYKCWSCQVGGNDAFKFVMQAGNVDFLTAVESLANKFGIEIPQEKPQHVAEPSTESFCTRMLRESGLTVTDTVALLNTEDGMTKVVNTFHPGTVNDKGELVPGDDVVIEYYDLDGNPIMYEKKDFNRKGTGQQAVYFRIRWQQPSAHKDKEGKEFKYRSPYGSDTPIYIPQIVRTAYKEQRPIERLFIQEGEKKAEKACKHGLFSIAISGIQNLGYKGLLPQDLKNIIRVCQVKEVIFLMDSDWNDLSHTKKLNEAIDKRPRNFFYAAKNYKDYMRGLKNEELYVEIYIGHVFRHNDDKGIDDLLAHTLAGKESALLDDLNHLINEKNLTGTYLQLFKITSWSDHKLEELWGIDNVQRFADMHREELMQMPEFLFQRHKWKFNENGEVVLAQPFDDDEKFWEEVVKTDRNGNERTECTYLYVNARNFLQNRGFGRHRLGDGTFNYIHVEPPFVSNIQSTDARDYLLQFAESNCSRGVIEMLLKGSTQYLGPDKLSMLNYIEPDFLEPSRDKQYFYFKDNCWIVSSSRVEQIPYSSITHHVWIERKRDFPVQYLGPLVTFDQSEDRYTYTLSDHGRRSHFLQFLINASNFTWRKEATEEITQQEVDENVQHLLSKLCAIGFMAMDCKDPNVSRAVIAMDGKQSEVGESNGRSGKSLVGELMRYITTIAYINGKKRDLVEDQFIWNDVTEKTRLVFIDDVLLNFNFEFLFPCITGDWSVNYKGGRRITFPYATSPKLYIPTNHTIRGEGSSYTDRQWLIAFSDYYNSSHKPADDFGGLFFCDWDFEQWNLTWNLVANCIQLYLKFGVVQAPGDRVEMRKLRQEITEGFILWADEFFSDPLRLDIKHSRKELAEKYYEFDPQQRRYVTPNEFKKRFKKWCQLRDYIFNPEMYDPTTGKPYKFDSDGKPITDNKSGGIEYFTVGVKEKKQVQENPNLPF